MLGGGKWGPRPLEDVEENFRERAGELFGKRKRKRSEGRNGSGNRWPWILQSAVECVAGFCCGERGRCRTREPLDEWLWTWDMDTAELRRRCT